ncbi:AAA family ATPase [Aeromonas allosaccharophila]|uniref:AAA family ATPase n=2 Tax=Aeromonas TaxID=642 RepID=A0A7T2PI06_9GAMM|nr:AAA family ATPase [Aeromonas allosaccharophila]QPR56179.1 AAA family ATPase [Aeromonas allosaccharophila]
MITNIVLDNVASYRSKTELKTEKKVNIIYGLNGSGKSTFSNYFYNSENTKYQQCSHISTDDTVLVYNQKFIQDNFYAKDTLNGIFSLSKENKEAKEKVEEITLELDGISKDKQQLQKDIGVLRSKIDQAKEIAQNKTWEIKTNYAGGDRVLEFCLKGKMGGKEPLFNHLCSIPLPTSKPSKTIANLKEEASAIDGELAIKHTPLKNLGIFDLPSDDLISLNEIIVGSEDSPVSKLIITLKNSDWVSEGLKYLEKIDGPQCPFCQSETITDELAKQIRDYFDETYIESVNNIKSIQVRYDSIIEGIPSLDDYKESQFSTAYIVKLNEYHAKLSKDTSANIELIKQKIANPSLQVTLTDVSSSVEEFNLVIDSINKLINEHNARIDNSTNELSRIKTEFWNILRYEYDQTISNFNNIKKNANKAITDKVREETTIIELEEAKDAERAEHQKSTVNIDDAILNINQGLIDIGITDFFIEKYENELYKIVRTGSNSKIFSSLSEGEKMIISFLYFRELFRGKQNATEGKLKKIAIIDDPVSSLSHIFVYNIGQLLKNDFFNSKEIEQVFVLTHSLYFFYELADANHERREMNQNLFRLSKNASGSSISSMKYEEIQNDYQSYWSVINDEKQPPALIANCMRNIIEYFFNFVQKADLSNVIQKPELKNIRFQSFLRYINRESHSLGQNIFDFKEFNYNDFKEGLRLVFEHTGYPEHYKKMSKIKT